MSSMDLITGELNAVKGGLRRQAPAHAFAWALTLRRGLCAGGVHRRLRTGAGRRGASGGVHRYGGTRRASGTRSRPQLNLTNHRAKTPITSLARAGGWPSWLP